MFGDDSREDMRPGWRAALVVAAAVDAAIELVLEVVGLKAPGALCEPPAEDCITPRKARCAAQSR